MVVAESYREGLIHVIESRGSRPRMFRSMVGARDRDLSVLNFCGLMLVLPLGVIFWEAFRKGFSSYLASFQDRYALQAIWMTCLEAGDRRPSELGVWNCSIMGHRQVLLPRQVAAHRLDRPPFCDLTGHIRLSLHFGLRHPRLARQMVGRLWHSNHLRRNRSGSGHDFCDLPVCRSRTHPTDARARERGRVGCSFSRCERLANILSRDVAEHALGRSVWSLIVQCPRDGRVWCRIGRLFEHSRGDQYDTSSHRRPLQRLQLRGSLRHGLDTGFTWNCHFDWKELSRTKARNGNPKLT